MSSGYCGVIEHDDECLCDVIIPNETPLIGDAVQDMWMGQEIVNLMGFTQDWDDESIIKYLGCLVYAKDNWARAIEDQALTVGETAPAQLRQQIRERLQSGGSSGILVVAEQLGLSYDDLMFVLFTNRRYMPPEQLEEFERDVIERKHSTPHSLGEKFGMPYKSAQKLHSYWGVPFGESTDKRSPILIRMDELLEDDSMNNKEINTILLREFGVKIKYSKISNRRHYNKNRRM